MDKLKLLEIESTKIIRLIESYTSEPSIITTLDFLKLAIKDQRIDEIFYHLSDIRTWYEQNMSKIMNNEYVIDHSEHQRAAQRLSSLLIEQDDFKVIETHKEPNRNENVICVKARYYSYKTL